MEVIVGGGCWLEGFFDDDDVLIVDVELLSMLLSKFLGSTRPNSGL